MSRARRTTRITSYSSSSASFSRPASSPTHHPPPPLTVPATRVVDGRSLAASQPLLLVTSISPMPSPATGQLPRPQPQALLCVDISRSCRSPCLAPTFAPLLPLSLIRLHPSLFAYRGVHLPPGSLATSQDPASRGRSVHPSRPCASPSCCIIGVRGAAVALLPPRRPHSGGERMHAAPAR